MVPKASSGVAAGFAWGTVPDCAPEVVPACDDGSVGGCWVGAAPAAQIALDTSVQTNRNLATNRAALLSRGILSRNLGGLAMKPFGFDEAQDGTHCSRGSKLARIKV